MEEYSISLTEVRGLDNDDNDYYDCWSAERASNIDGEWIGQYLVYGTYWISRTYLKIPLADIPAGRFATEATITIYIQNFGITSRYLSSFDITVVDYKPNESDIYASFDDFGSVSMGTLTITDSTSKQDTHEISLNAAGLEKLNDALADGDDYVYFGLRTNRDIEATEPELKTGHTTAAEYVQWAMAGQFALDMTTANWPADRYPDVPVFPDIGFMDVGTYGCIKAYIEDLTHYISEVITGDNIVLATDGIIELWQTSPLLAPEEIAKNSVATGVEFLSLSPDSTITTCDGVDVEALTNTTLTTSGNASVTNDLNINSTGYTSIKEQIEHDNLWWQATSSTPSVAATKAKIYQELSTGDLKITINSGGSTKTAILADFSAL